MTSPRLRYDGLDGLRGLAAGAVLLYHVTLHDGGLTLFASAPLAVDLFFCLSGFVIAHAYQARIAAGLSLVGFLRLRLIRLYPAYLVGFALGLLALLLKLAVGQAAMSGGAVALATLLNLFYLPFLGTHSLTYFANTVPGAIFPLNDPGWSLFFEFVANIAFFFVMTRLRWRPLLITLFLLPLFAATTKLFGEAAGWGTQNFLGGFPRVGFSFFAGVTLYHYRSSLEKLPRLPAWCLLLGLALLLAVPAFRLHTYYWFAATVALVPPLIALGTRCRLGDRGIRWAQYGGALSYPLYCVHFPVLGLVSALLPEPAWRLPAVILSLGLSWLVAHFLARHAEGALSQYLAAKLPA